MNKRLHNLHALRGWAALFVVISHAKYPFWSGGTEYMAQYPMATWSISDYLVFAVDMITSFGSLFVITFFVLSGFFIARSLELKSYTPLFFYGDRVIRIYIPYIASMLLGYFFLHYAFIVNPELLTTTIERAYITEIISSYKDLSLSSMLNALIFTPGESGNYFGNNNPYWSLFYEAIFYVVIPFFIFYMNYTWFLTLIILVYSASFFISSGWLTILSFFTNYFFYFVMGIMLYKTLSNKKRHTYLLKMSRKYTNTFIILSFLLLAVSILLGLLKYKYRGYFISSLGTLLLIMWILYGRNSKLFSLVYKVLINRFSNFLGQISFSLYLVHVPIYVFMYALLTKATGEYIFYERIYWIFVALVIPFGYLFYYFVERNSLKLLKAYKKKYGNK